MPCIAAAASINASRSPSMFIEKRIQEENEKRREAKFDALQSASVSKIAKGASKKPTKKRQAIGGNLGAANAARKAERSK